LSEAFVLASGPSLTPEDVERVRVWRSEDYSRFVIVTNTTFRIAPWADLLFSCDGTWLVKFHEEVKSTFKGKVTTCSLLGSKFGAENVKGQCQRFLNSGAGAVSLAISRGATKVYMLGMDCQFMNGKKHWHGDHPQGLGNAHSMSRWPHDFEKLAKYAKERRVEVRNCSRSTALKSIPLMSLEDALQAT
jgi:hypothetical protein